MLVHLIKKYLVWMVLSYILIAGIVYHFIFIPQGAKIEKYKVEKSGVEYTYMKITSSPSFINSLNEAIRKAVVKSNDFEWVDAGNVDASLTFYNYIAETAKKTNLDLLETTALKNNSAKEARLAKTYYTWTVMFSGNFQDVMRFIDEIEHNRRFLMIREISVISRGTGPEDKPLYDLVFRGIKKDDGDVKKTQS